MDSAASQHPCDQLQELLLNAGGDGFVEMYYRLFEREDVTPVIIASTTLAEAVLRNSLDLSRGHIARLQNAAKNMDIVSLDHTLTMVSCEEVACHPLRKLSLRAGGVDFVDKYFNVFHQEDIDSDLIANGFMGTDVLRQEFKMSYGNIAQLQEAARSIESIATDIVPTLSTTVSATKTIQHKSLPPSAPSFESSLNPRQVSDEGMLLPLLESQQSQQQGSSALSSTLRRVTIAGEDSAFLKSTVIPSSRADFSLQSLDDADTTDVVLVVDKNGDVNSSKLDILIGLVVAQKAQLDAQQAQLDSIGAQGLAITAADSMSSRANESQLDEMIRCAKNQLLQGTTAVTWRKRKEWYENTFGRRIEDDDADMITETVCKWILDPTNSIKASSKRSILGAIHAILVTRGTVLDISPETERRRKSLYNVLVKQEEKDRARGLSKEWIAFSNLDYRHMFNRILEQYESLPVEKLQIFFLLLLGKLVGRPSGELVWIAAASWQIKFHRVFDRWVSQLTFQYCFQKICGPGKYTASFMESDADSGEVPPVALALLVLEKKHIIPSAIEAYTNVNGKLDIDTSVHETSNDLSELLTLEHNKLRDANPRGIAKKVDDDDDTMFEDMIS